MNTPKLSKRLEAAASFARSGRRVADIGTDHAYLPIYLCSKGVAPSAVASDINEGPVNRAKINVATFGAQGRIEVVRTDGLDGIYEFDPEDIYILGMGGELICNILDRASLIKKEGIRLILQPMTHPETVRKYLYSHGFDIVDECIVKDDKLYQIIAAEFVGSARKSVPTEVLHFGEHNIRRGGELFALLLERYRHVYTERLRGKSMSGEDICEETQMLLAIDKIKKEKFSEEER